MLISFKKSHDLPFLKAVFNHTCKPRDYWNFHWKMVKEDGFCHQPEKEEFLVQKGAYAGDIYSMCALARILFQKNDRSLPQALSWWHRAAPAKDAGTLKDLQTKPIYARILAYQCAGCSEYANIEVKCAMLTEWILTDMGRTDWTTLPPEERQRRCSTLVDKASTILCINAPLLEFREELRTPRTVGTTSRMEWRIAVRTSMLDDYEGLITVLFHELGHVVQNSIKGSEDKKSLRLRELYGVTREQVEAWSTDAVGSENRLIAEVDADTLGYGVWSTWAIYFKH